MRKAFASGALLGALVVGLLAGQARPAAATLDMQKAAKAAGFETTGGCLYCHGEKMPKKGAVTHNDRGNWLIAEKAKRKAKAVDVAWLKDYVEPKK
jgi:hypothetical protein